MKSTFLLASAAVALAFTSACHKPETCNNPNADATRTVVTNPAVQHSTARVGAGYSQSVTLDEANKMISSYLTSVNYPYQDSAIRSLSFDADSLRAYLKDSRITTMKFVFGHQLSYVASGSDVFGKYVGMKPNALTIIAVGVDENNSVIRNSTGGVYEHALPCPNMCGAEIDAFLH